MGCHPNRGSKQVRGIGAGGGGLGSSTANDLAANSAHHSLAVPGEQFSLTVDYWTDYNAGSWQTPATQEDQPVHTPGAGRDGHRSSAGGTHRVLQCRDHLDGRDAWPGRATCCRHGARTTRVCRLPDQCEPSDNVLSVEGFDPILIDRWMVVAGDQPRPNPACSPRPCTALPHPGPQHRGCQLSPTHPAGHAHGCRGDRGCGEHLLDGGNAAG